MMLVDVKRQDTICALATPPLESAIALVRVSGPNALEILQTIFQPKKNPQRFFVATLGDVLHIDEALCISYPQGKSYTGEPSFELCLHGNPLLVKQVLEALKEAGCRMATPGEFSMRAVLSGKMDLCEAEAVSDLIHARSKEAAQAALRNLKGGLETCLAQTRASIINALCETEARLDFPDEDLGEKRSAELLSDLQNGIDTLARLLKGAQLGARLTQGARLVILGLPNAGKSTLLNALVGEEKALVYHLPGTTRDVLEATWVVNGIPVCLVDVAGIREGDNLDPVEAMGIQKARQELARADGVLWLVDGLDLDSAHTLDVQELLKENPAPVLKIHTKADLVDSEKANDKIWISAHTSEGLETLQERIYQLLVQETPSPDEVLLTHARQKEEVEAAHEALLMAHEALKSGLVDEIVASELRSAGAALDRLLGTTLNEDVLDLIFSRFCIGK